MDIPATKSAPQDLEETLAKMSHSIRTPLHVISGLSSILASSSALAPAEKKMADMMKNNIEQLTTLVDNMVAFTHAVIAENNKKGAVATTDGTKKKILVVTDQLENLPVIESFISSFGHSYDVAKSGPEALCMLAAARYDLVLIDIQISEMDGLETSSRIRAWEKERNTPRLPILVATSATEDEEPIYKKIGVDACLPKPFGRDQLAPLLQKYISA